MAREVYAFLKSIGVAVWFDKESLVAGQDWDRERSEAQTRADLTVLICSAETLERGGVIQREVREILDLLRDKPLGQIYLVTVRTDELRLPPELAKYQYINHFEPDWKVKLARSLELKHKQAGAPNPPDLNNFIQSSGAPEPVSVKSIRETSHVIELEAEFLHYNLDGPYWNFVNSVIFSDVMKGWYGAKRSLDGEPLPDAVPNQWSIRVEEFFRKGEVVSLRYFIYWYGTGAAHPNHHIQTVNIGGSKLGPFSLSELFGGSLDVALLLMRYCELDLRRQFSAVDDDLHFLSFPENEDEAWDTFSEFSFDSEGITINLSPYSVLAYAYGSQEVRIPWSMVEDKIAPEFRSGPLQSLIEAQSTG